MSSKKLGKGLGDMGLSELLGGGQPEEESVSLQGQVMELAVEQLQPGRYQPRQHFSEEALKELSESIKQQGVIQPLVVRKTAGNKYEIIAGERRWRAAKLAGLTQVPIVEKQLTDQAAMAIALIENIQRQDLNPIEESVALQRLISEFDMTHQQVAEAVGKSRATVTNLLRLLQLTPNVRRLLEDGSLEMGHARTLISLNDDQQLKVANYIVSKKLSVRETERFVKQLQQPHHDKPATKLEKNPDVLRLERELSNKLNADVHFEHQANGGGKMVVKYHSLDELDGILAKIQ